jgi:hypothetical protein
VALEQALQRGILRDRGSDDIQLPKEHQILPLHSSWPGAATNTAGSQHRANEPGQQMADFHADYLTILRGAAI